MSIGTPAIEEAMSLCSRKEPLHAHWDCFSGAAGDMMLAACLDAAGEKSDELLQIVRQGIRQGLPELADEFEIQGERVWRGIGSIAAMHVSVHSTYDHAPAPVPVHLASGSVRGVEGLESHSHEHEHHRARKKQHDHAHSHEHLHRVVKNENDGHIHDHKERAAPTFPGEMDEAITLGSTEDQHAHSHSHVDSSSQGPIRNLPQIRHMLRVAPEGCIPLWVRDRAIAAFTELALAEAAVHAADSIDAVHFHEVGAVDSIVDVVGTLLALYYLGVETLSCSRLPIGEGMVKTAHGILPVPAPATLRLMVGMPVTPGPPGLTGELVTPTAAALLKVLTKNSDGRPPRFTIRKIGVGAGTKDFSDHPNIIRLILGDNLDDRSDAKTSI